MGRSNSGLGNRLRLSFPRAAAVYVSVAPPGSPKNSRRLGFVQRVGGAAGLNAGRYSDQRTFQCIPGGTFSVDADLLQLSGLRKLTMCLK
jgi:hypothetical protein